MQPTKQKYLIWWLGLLAAAFAFAVYVMIPARDGATFWARSVGAMLGLILPGLVLGGIAWVIDLIAKRKKGHETLLWTVTIVAIFSMVGNFSIYQQRIESGIRRPEKSIRFSPNGAEFAVEFSGRPQISPLKVQTPEGVSLEGVMAEFSMPNKFERAEYVVVPRGSLAGETSASAISKMKAYAAANRIVSPEYSFEATDIGNRVIMRGLQIGTVNGQRDVITVEARLYYGDSCIFGLYVGAPSVGYPPESAEGFLASIRRIDVLPQ